MKRGMTRTQLTTRSNKDFGRTLVGGLGDVPLVVCGCRLWLKVLLGWEQGCCWIAMRLLIARTEWIK